MEVEEVRSGQSHVGSCGQPGGVLYSLTEGHRAAAIGPASRRAAQAGGKECNAKMREVVASQPQAVGGWAAATCETHERGEAWD